MISKKVIRKIIIMLFVFAFSINSFSHSKKDSTRKFYFGIGYDKLYQYFDYSHLNNYNYYTFVETINYGHKTTFNLGLRKKSFDFSLMFGSYKLFIENNGTYTSYFGDHHGPSGYYSRGSRISNLNYRSVLTGNYFQLNFGNCFNLYTSKNFNILWIPALSIGMDWVKQENIENNTVIWQQGYTNYTPDTSITTYSSGTSFYQNDNEQMKQNDFIEVNTQLKFEFNHFGVGLILAARKYGSNVYRCGDLNYDKRKYYWGTRFYFIF